MPELPEVETIRLQLKPNIVGKTITEIKVLSSKNFIGNKKDAINKKIVNIQRYGKVLTLKLVNPLTHKLANYLNIHFKLTGQMLFAKNINLATFKNKIPFTKGKTMPANTTRVIIKFNDNSGLFFNDLRKFGWIKITNKPLIPKGIDVLSTDFSVKYLTKVVGSTKKPIKILLMDQDLITGIGNIYANDALFMAKVHPLRPSNSLSDKEISRLYSSIKKVINEGLKHGGSSGADEAFINPSGEKGRHQRYFLVYQKEGESCLVCQTLIKRIKHHGRSSFFCQKCQKFNVES